jgi:hypothetical protein
VYFYTEKLLKNLLKLQDELVNYKSYILYSDIVYNHEIILKLVDEDDKIKYLHLRPIEAGGYNIQCLHVRFISTIRTVSVELA